MMNWKTAPGNSRRITEEDIVPEKFASQNGTFRRTLESLSSHEGGKVRVETHRGKHSLLRPLISYRLSSLRLHA